MDSGFTMCFEIVEVVLDGAKLYCARRAFSARVSRVSLYAYVHLLSQVIKRHSEYSIHFCYLLSLYQNRRRRYKLLSARYYPFSYILPDQEHNPTTYRNMENRPVIA